MHGAIRSSDFLIVLIEQMSKSNLDAWDNQEYSVVDFYT